MNIRGGIDEAEKCDFKKGMFQMAFILIRLNRRWASVRYQFNDSKKKDLSRIRMVDSFKGTF